MGAVTMASEIPFDHFTQAAAEKAAIKQFNTPGQQWGGEDCKRVLRDWFPQLLARVLAQKARMQIYPTMKVRFGRHLICWANYVMLFLGI